MKALRFVDGSSGWLDILCINETYLFISSFYNDNGLAL